MNVMERMIDNRLNPLNCATIYLLEKYCQFEDFMAWFFIAWHYYFVFAKKSIFCFFFVCLNCLIGGRDNKILLEWTETFVNKLCVPNVYKKKVKYSLYLFRSLLSKYLEEMSGQDNNSCPLKMIISFYWMELKSRRY